MELTEPFVIDPFPVPPVVDRIRQDLEEFLRLHLNIDEVPWTLDDGRVLVFELIQAENPIVWQLRYIGANEPPHWFVIPFDGLYWVHEDEGRVEKWWDGEIVEERHQDGPGRIAIPF